MEDTLRAFLPYFLSIVHLVLILVLMEDTLRGNEQFHSYRLHLQVLILVLMEDTLRGFSLLHRK